MTIEIERIRNQVDSSPVWSHCRANGRTLLARYDAAVARAEKAEAERDALRAGLARMTLLYEEDALPETPRPTWLGALLTPESEETSDE